MLTVARRPDVTVLIATYNRADLLARTLDSLAASRMDRPWDVLVVDNNSADHTPDVVAARQPAYPVPLRYLFEPRQGKSVALNTALAAVSAPLIAFTDDDVDVPPGWLQALAEPLFARKDVDYTGGPVCPMWEGPKPAWLDETGNLGGTIAVKDHGDEPFIFEDRARTPLGVNMCVKRSLLDRVGGFNAGLGRRGASLLGQEQAEFFCRSRASGARGLYVPEARLSHFVPAARLTRRYFRRWWYWKGVSQARLHRLHPVTELGVDLRRTPHLLNVPKFLYGNAVRNLLGWIRALAARDRRSLADREMSLVYFLGYWRDRQRGGPEGTEQTSSHVEASAS